MRNRAYDWQCRMTAIALQWAISTSAESRTLADVVMEMQDTFPDNRPITLVVHGHSVPAGYFVTPEIRTFDAYPHLLHIMLKKRFPNAALAINVTAIGGENSASGAQRFADVMVRKPNLVIIDYGLNDRGLTLADAETAWRSMIERALDIKAAVMLLTPTPDLNADLEDENDPLNMHAEQIRRLAKEYSVTLIDSLSAFRRAGVPLDSLMSQSNHPNRAGHEIVARLMFEAMDKARGLKLEPYADDKQLVIP